MQLTIQDIAFGGKGVGRSDGLVVFVLYTLTGERVTVELTQRKKNFAEARLVNIDEPSPERIEPPCPYFGRCGGCAYQHMAYPAQLAIKTTQVEQTLRRVGKLVDPPMRPMCPSPKPYAYRNRIRVHTAQGVVGYYSSDHLSLLDIETCAIASPEVNAHLAGLRSRRLPDGDYTLRQAAPKGFFDQTNPEAALLLLELVTAHLTPGGRLVDAYCGAGFFAHPLRERFEEVIGIEENEFAVAHARAYAAPHERYIAGDVAQVLSEWLTPHATLILDPPAAGLSARVIDTILAVRPGEIVYVSCNPGTLARDLARLQTAYSLESVTPLDMFPQTAEIEAVVFLKLK